MAGITFFNTKEQEWSDVGIRIDGAELIKCTGIEYSCKQKQEHLYAAGNKPIGIQSGNREYSGTLTILNSCLDELNTAAIAAGAPDILGVSFDIVVSYAAATARDEVIEVLMGCRVSEAPKNWKQGDMHAECKLPFLFLDKV
jgi:hypothetical protein